LKIRAEPHDYEFDLKHTALVLIDFQNDFILPGGFGESLGNKPELLQKAIKPTKNILQHFRNKGLHIFHTREGHKPDLSDCPDIKLKIGKKKIGDKGPMGKILIRGEKGQEIIEELAPIKGEQIIDKPGKGAFYNTNFDKKLKSKDIKYLIIAGVTTEVCVDSTIREANDRGYSVLVLKDCVASYKPKLHQAALEMVISQGGIFGCVGSSKELLKVLKNRNWC